MKRRKTILYLLGVLGVACVVTLAVTKIEEKKEQIANTDEEILTVDSDQVDSLSWKYEDTELSFHKTDGVWHLDEDNNFPVDEDKIKELLSCFESFGAAFKIEDVDDLSQYGLDKPVCTIDFTSGDQSYEVCLGDFSTMDSQRYVSIGNDCVYLVKTDPYDTFAITLADTIKNDTLPSFDEISSITFTGEENYTITSQEDSTDSYCEKDKYFTNKNGSNLPLDTVNVESYCSAISRLSLSDYVSYNVSDEELAAWGLDNPALTVSIDYTDTDDDGNSSSQTFQLAIGLNQEELAQAEEDTADTAANAEDTEAIENAGDAEAIADAGDVEAIADAGDVEAIADAGDTESSTDAWDTDSTDAVSATASVTSYLRIGQSQIVYQLNNTDFQALLAASYNDLRHDEVMTADMNQVTQMDISLDGSTYSIYSEITEDADTPTYTYQDEEIDGSSLSKLITALKIKEFTDKTTDGKQEISILFHLANENYPEISLEIYRYDGNSCLVVLDGKTLGLVDRADAVDLIEAVNAIVLG